MALEKLLGKIALIGGLSLFGYSCESSSPNTTYCSKDTDCKGDRVCDSSTKMCVDASSNNSQIYTCESGSKMIVETCCPLPEINCSGESLGYQKMYGKWLGECQEEVTKGKSSSDINRFFSCAYNICTTKSPPIKDKFDICQSYLW